MSPIRAAGRHARKVVVLIVGVTVLLAGVALLALPGPGMIVIIVGLLILSTEFAWAERWLDFAVEKAAGATSKAQESKNGRIMLGFSGLALITVGVLVILFFSNWIAAGISLIFAGVIGLCTLLPKVQDWIAEKAITGINDTDDVA
jgi:uncharacterized protein (TIGR02611 family)